MLYDWANSAFFTVVIGVLIGPYLLNLAQTAVGEDGVVLDLFIFKVTPKGLPAFCTAVSVISMVIFLPLLGAIADYTHLKKALMAVFCYAGVLAALLDLDLEQIRALLGQRERLAVMRQAALARARPDALEGIIARIGVLSG